MIEGIHTVMKGNKRSHDMLKPFSGQLPIPFRDHNPATFVFQVDLSRFDVYWYRFPLTESYKTTKSSEYRIKVTATHRISLTQIHPNHLTRFECSHIALRIVVVQRGPVSQT